MVVRSSTRVIRQRHASTKSQTVEEDPWAERDVGLQRGVTGSVFRYASYPSFMQDALLRAAVKRHGPKKWRDIAAMVSSRRKSRSESCCRKRWAQLTNYGSSPEKRKWSPEEDAALTVLVEKNERENWALVASQLPGRSAKQCRERWQNQVRPDLNHGPWQRSEDEVIIAWQHRVGNKWATIAKKLDGRTDNMVKNRWYSTLAREKASFMPSLDFQSSPSIVPKKTISKYVKAQQRRRNPKKRGHIKVSPTLKKQVKMNSVTLSTESLDAVDASADVRLSSFVDSVRFGIDDVAQEELPSFFIDDVERYDDWVPPQLEAPIVPFDATSWSLVDDSTVSLSDVGDDEIDAVGKESSDGGEEGSWSPSFAHSAASVYH